MKISTAIYDWVDHKLSRINPPRSLKQQEPRIRKELDELREAIETDQSPEVIAMELADVVISCYTAARLALSELGVDLDRVILEKNAINWRREWEIGPDGLGRHVKVRSDEQSQETSHGGDSSGRAGPPGD
jgi:NTP pyrophosphatase (non-canonical NTP hydrolase)